MKSVSQCYKRQGRTDPKFRRYSQRQYRRNFLSILISIPIFPFLNVDSIDDHFVLRAFVLLFLYLSLVSLYIYTRDNKPKGVLDRQFVNTSQLWFVFWIFNKILPKKDYFLLSKHFSLLPKIFINAFHSYAHFQGDSIQDFNVPYHLHLFKLLSFRSMYRMNLL